MSVILVILAFGVGYLVADLRHFYLNNKEEIDKAVEEEKTLKEEHIPEKKLKSLYAEVIGECVYAYDNEHNFLFQFQTMDELSVCFSKLDKRFIWQIPEDTVQIMARFIDEREEVNTI